jgi:hypothetical protein
MATEGTKKQRNGNGANLGFEAQLWAAADDSSGTGFLGD